MSSTNRGAERVALDAYYTPDPLARKLVGLLDVRGKRVLEPHAGGGAFVRALVAAGAHRVLAGDINPQAPIMLAPPAMGVTLAPGVNFLSVAWNDIDIVVGNPPFSGFKEHVEHALTVAPTVAFLLRLAVMESASCVRRWARWPLAEVFVLAERPSFTGQGAYGFFIFRRGAREIRIRPEWSWKAKEKP
jgi:predicted RNA methylase